MTRIVTVPEVVVEVQGSTAGRALHDALTGVRVRSRLAAPAQCELTFAGGPPAPADIGRFRPGSSLSVSVANEPFPLFEGEVTAVERRYGADHALETRVRGYDLLHRLRKDQPLRALPGVTAESLAQELASDLGLDVEAAASGPEWPLLIQHRQSNLELLLSLCQRCGLFPIVTRGRLELVTLEGTGDPIPLVLGDSLLELRIDVNAAPSNREVAATGWDTALVDVHTATVGTARSGRDSSASAAPDAVGGSGRRDLTDQPAPSDAHAEAAAQAELDRHAAAEVVLWAMAAGDPHLHPGCRVHVKGAADDLDGRYVVTEATHTIDDELGYVTEISTAPPAPLVTTRGSTATYGTVTDIGDPEGTGRIKVSLPTLGDLETDWMPVAGVGAGAGKGVIALPDVGDRVLVLMAHEDPARGVVLGGLYGGEGPPDTGIEADAVARYTMLTPKGQRVTLDDALGVVRVENAGGSFVELGPDKTLVRSIVDLEIAAPGRALTVRANTVDFVRATEPEPATYRYLPHPPGGD